MWNLELVKEAAREGLQLRVTSGGKAYTGVVTHNGNNALVTVRDGRRIVAERGQSWDCIVDAANHVPFRGLDIEGFDQAPATPAPAGYVYPSPRMSAQQGAVLSLLARGGNLWAPMSRKTWWAIRPHDGGQWKVSDRTMTWLEERGQVTLEKEGNDWRAVLTAEGRHWGDRMRGE